MDTIDTNKADSAQTFERPFGTASVEQLEVQTLEQDLRELGTEGKEGTEGTVSPLRAALRRFLRDKRAVFCLGVVLFISIGSFIFPLFYIHMGPTIKGGFTGTELVPPEKYHDPFHPELGFSDYPGTLLNGGPQHLAATVYPLGADQIGRDLLARIMGGVNTSVELALLVEVLDIGLGVLLGTLAGWFGGWLGTLLDRFTDIVFAFPGILLIILIGATMGPLFDEWFHGQLIGRVFLLTLAIGLLAWPLMMRFVRGRTLELKEQQFVEAARTVGGTDRQIILRHIVPNLMNIVVVAATLDMLATIIGEAGLSIIGAGLRPPANSLGLLISDGAGRVYDPTAWTQLFWPCIVLVVLVICFSFVGDGVRDAFDPRTKD